MEIYPNFHRESITQVAAYGSSNVFATVLRGGFTSSKNGDEWSESLNNRSRHNITALDIMGSTIYAGMYDGRLLKSADNGATWNEVPDNSAGGFRVTALDVVGESILYGVTRNSAPVGGGIHYSSNSGLNWSSLGGSKYGVSDVAINNNYLYAASPFCLRGRDVLSTQWDTLINYRTYDVEIGFNYIFAYTGKGVKRSPDNGITWIDITNGLDTGSSFNDMLYFNNRLYIAFDSMFVSTNDGDQWYSINDGLSDTTITKITANDKYIFAATGSGVWRRPVDILVKIPSKNAGIPDKFLLSQNYPNPFNPETKIKFSVPKQSHVKLIVYDLLGREVATLVNDVRNPGYYEVPFDAENYASGVYFYRMEARDFIDVKKMLLIK